MKVCSIFLILVLSLCAAVTGAPVAGAEIFRSFVTNPVQSILSDFSYTGFASET